MQIKMMEGPAKKLFEKIFDVKIPYASFIELNGLHGYNHQNEDPTHENPNMAPQEVRVSVSLIASYFDKGIPIIYTSSQSMKDISERLDDYLTGLEKSIVDGKADIRYNIDLLEQVNQLYKYYQDVSIRCNYQPKNQRPEATILNGGLLRFLTDDFFNNKETIVETKVERKYDIVTLLKQRMQKR